MNLKERIVLIEAIIPQSTILTVKQPLISEAIVLQTGEGCEVEVGNKVAIPKTPLAKFDDNKLYLSEDDIIATL